MAYKKKETCTLSVFELGVLHSVSEIRSTAEEIHRRYILLHPQSRIKKVFIPPASCKKVKYALSSLVSLNLVATDLLSYTDQPLEKETVVYSLSTEGRQALSHKKR